MQLTSRNKIRSRRRHSSLPSYPIKVMESVPSPRLTTNPYNKMLSAALAANPHLEHQHFTWRTALFGRYAVFHWHWPEAALSGASRLKIIGKHVALAALIFKHRVNRVAVVRTVHNVQPPDTNRFASWMLRVIDRNVSLRIVLNEQTEVAEGCPSMLVPHGHYRDWFADFPRQSRVPMRIGYFGTVRRYKSIDSLLEAYAELSTSDERVSLRVGGKPSTPALGESVRTKLAGLHRAEGKLTFLSDAELVGLATSSQIIVLPYRHMHNSGSVLAALSLYRPVLVPRNPTNEALAREVGDEWVHMFDGALDAEDLRRALAATTDHMSRSAPDLSRRDWDLVGERHLEAYRRALARLSQDAGLRTPA